MLSVSVRLPPVPPPYIALVGASLKARLAEVDGMERWLESCALCENGRPPAFLETGEPEPIDAEACEAGARPRPSAA